MKMSKLLIYHVLIVFIGLLSCKKNNESTDTSISSDQIATGKTIVKDEPPRSQKKFGEFESNGETVASPSHFNNSDNTASQEKLTILTTSGSSQLRSLEVGVNSWSSNEYAIIFNINGTYIKFNYSTKKWSWGFYYVNQSITYLVIDPETSLELKFEIKTLSTTTFVVLHNNITINFQPKLLTGYSIEPYQDTDVYALLKGKNLYTSKYDFSLNLCELGTNFYLQFLEIGRGASYKNNTISDNWTWLMRNGKLVINSNTSNEQIFSLDYIANDQVGLSYYDAEKGGEVQWYLMTLANYTSIYKNELIQIQDPNFDCSGGNTVTCDFDANTANSVLDLSSQCQLLDQIWGLGSNSINLGGGLNFSTTPGIGWSKKFGTQYLTSFSLASDTGAQYITTTNTLPVNVYGPTDGVYEIWNLETMTVVSRDTSSVTFSAEPNTRYGGFAWYVDNKQADIAIYSSPTPQ